MCQMIPRNKNVGPISAVAFSVLILVVAGCSSDPALPSSQTIDGEPTNPLTPAQQARLDDALDVLKGVCGLNGNDMDNDLADGVPGVVDLADTESRENDAIVYNLVGTHDNDTIAIDFDSLSDGRLVTVLKHEYTHQQAAAAAGLEKDPNTNHEVPGMSPGDQMCALSAHINMMLEDIKCRCEMSVANESGLPILSDPETFAPPYSCDEKSEDYATHNFGQLEWQENAQAGEAQLEGAAKQEFMAKVQSCPPEGPKPDEGDCPCEAE